MARNFQKAKLSDQQVNILLKEYELCQSYTGDLEKFIWTTASILVPSSIAGFAYLGINISTNAKIIEYVFPIGVSVLSILFIWYWRTMVARWYSFQKVTYFRASEIEEQLGMYKDRYIVAYKAASAGRKHEDDSMVDAMILVMKPKFYNKSVRLTVSRIGTVLIIAWIAFIFIQIAAMLNIF
jgi:hypothetical protein